MDFFSIDMNVKQETGPPNAVAPSIAFQQFGDFDCTEFEQRVVWPAALSVLEDTFWTEVREVVMIEQGQADSSNSVQKFAGQKWRDLNKVLKVVHNHRYKELEAWLGADNFALFGKTCEGAGNHAQLSQYDFFQASAVFVEEGGGKLKREKKTKKTETQERHASSEERGHDPRDQHMPGPKKDAVDLIKLWRMREVKVLFYGNIYVRLRHAALLRLDEEVRGLEEHAERRVRFCHAVEFLAELLPLSVSFFLLFGARMELRGNPKKLEKYSAGDGRSDNTKFRMAKVQQLFNRPSKVWLTPPNKPSKGLTKARPVQAPAPAPAPAPLDLFVTAAVVAAVAAGHAARTAPPLPEPLPLPLPLPLSQPLHLPLAQPLPAARKRKLPPSPPRRSNRIKERGSGHKRRAISDDRVSAHTRTHQPPQPLQPPQAPHPHHTVCEFGADSLSLPTDLYFTDASYPRQAHLDS
ncbi:hypothetical protein B484DRAFT_456975, partial [Ochromonadaceae sp. CCMP2298]